MPDVSWYLVHGTVIVDECNNTFLKCSYMSGHQFFVRLLSPPVSYAGIFFLTAESLNYSSRALLLTSFDYSEQKYWRMENLHIEKAVITSRAGDVGFTARWVGAASNVGCTTCWVVLYKYTLLGCTHCWVGWTLYSARLAEFYTLLSLERVLGCTTCLAAYICTTSETVSNTLC